MTGEDLTACEAVTISAQLLVDAPDLSTIAAYRLAILEFVGDPKTRTTDLRVTLSGVDETVFPAQRGFRLDILARPDWSASTYDRYDRQRHRDWLNEQIPRFARDIAAHLLDRFAGLPHVLMLEDVGSVTTKLTRPEQD